MATKTPPPSKRPAAKARSSKSLRTKAQRREPPRDIFGYDPVATAHDHVFDWEAAEFVVNFVESNCLHVKGRLKGAPLVLQPWERDYYYTLFGWLDRKTGLRRYTKSLNTIARKNSKTTTFAAPIGLYMTGPDGESRAENYVIATDKEQAGVLLEIAGLMVRDSPTLRKYYDYIAAQKRIVHHASESFMAALPSDPEGANAINPYLIENDETHVTPTDLLNTIQTGLGARDNQLTLFTTTAGNCKDTEWYRLLELARKVIKGSQLPESKRNRHDAIDAPSFLPLVCEVPEKADWTKEKNWYLANPNLGKSIAVRQLQEECAEAKRDPIKENMFRRMRCNQFVEQQTRFIQMQQWDACEVPPKQWPKLDGRECFGGLDLSSSRDLTAYALVFEVDGRYFARVKLYWPPGSAAERERETTVPITRWIREGHVIASRAQLNFTDYELIATDIKADRERYKFREIGFDPYNATQLANDLDAFGIPMVPVPQTIKGLNEATKAFSRLLGEGNFAHDGNPCLAWCAENIEVFYDKSGYVRPVKPLRPDGRGEDPHKKIDGIVATITALARALIAPPAKGSIYDDRDLLVL